MPEAEVHPLPAVATTGSRLLWGRASRKLCDEGDQLVILLAKHPKLFDDALWSSQLPRGHGCNVSCHDLMRKRLLDLGRVKFLVR